MASSSADLVAGHYNSRPNIDVQKRKKSKIIYLKNFNNWIKSVLISQYCHPDYTVLDMGCGKGGDIQKWGLAKIKEYVGADIASVSIQQARERYQERYPGFPAQFFAIDCYSRPLAPLLSPDFTFDLVSMQFCLHYSFETKDKARQMLSNVTSNLRQGGWFIGTIPNANWIVKRKRALPPEGDPALPEAEKEPGGRALKFGNSIYSIRFEEEEPFREFGCKYWFHLEDAVDCPEYLVHFPTFQKLADEYSLDLKLKETFHQFYADKSQNPEFAQLLKRMQVFGDREEMSNEEWEAAGGHFLKVKNDKDRRKALKHAQNGNA